MTTVYKSVPHQIANTATQWPEGRGAAVSLKGNVGITFCTILYGP